MQPNADKILKPAMSRYLSWLTDDFIARVEKDKGCKFVGEFPVRPHSTVVGALFYQDKPPQPDYSKYFFLYVNYTGMEDHPDEGKLFITSGEHMDHRVLSGVITPNGDFIYSRGRHDCFTHDGAMVDGGDSYLRSNMVGTSIKFEIVEDKLVHLERFDDEPQKQSERSDTETKDTPKKAAKK